METVGKMLQQWVTLCPLWFFIFLKKRITDRIFTRKELANNLYAKMYVFNVALALNRIGLECLNRCEQNGRSAKR